MDKFEELFHDSLDPRVTDWHLVGRSPLIIWVLSAAYLCFVLWLGPLLMRNRKPLELKPVMFVYNVMLVVLSAYMTVEIFLSSVSAGYSWSCGVYNKASQNPTDKIEMRVARVLWWFYYSKFIEFFDTVLMVLRKKQQQVSFLHVFHHVSILNIWWFVMSFTPGGNSYFGPLFNSAVHTVMYGYYALAIFPSLRPYLWWKRYITQFQLLQFLVVFIQTTLVLFNGCDYPDWGKYVLSSYMVMMVALFSNFYIQSYRKSEQQRA